MPQLLGDVVGKDSDEYKYKITETRNSTSILDHLLCARKAAQCSQVVSLLTERLISFHLALQLTLERKKFRTCRC